jgi:hypothetical protein
MDGVLDSMRREAWAAYVAAQQPAPVAYKLGLKPEVGAPKVKIHWKLNAPPASPDKVDHFAGWKLNLGGNDKWGDCVAPETRVLTADLQWVPAGSLSIGDRLVGFDEEPDKTGRGRYYREAVVECADIVKRPCYDLEFSDGTKVRSSSGHRWLTRSTVQGELGCQRWVETKDMKCGDVRQTKVVKSFDVWDDNTSYAGGYLAGAFDGEGNLELSSHDGIYANRVCFSQVDNPMLAQVEKYLGLLGFRYTHTKTSNGTALRVDGTPRFEKHRIAITPRSEWVRFMGSIRPARLLPKLDINRLGRINGQVVTLVQKTFVGEQDVVMLDTSARTYFAEGLASHNCGPVSAANHLQMNRKYLLNKDSFIGLPAILDLYSRSTNPPFNPATGANDNGVVMSDLLAAMKDGGLDGDKVIAYASFADKSDASIQAAINEFGGVLFAVNLQTAQQTQTNAGYWDYQRSRPWGGHAILAGKYDRTQGRVNVVTWGKDVYTTAAFRRYQLSEVWLPIWKSAVDSGKFFANIDRTQFLADYKALTGEDFPVPIPVPPPPPPPPPVTGFTGDVPIVVTFKDGVPTSVKLSPGSPKIDDASIRAAVRKEFDRMFPGVVRVGAIDVNTIVEAIVNLIKKYLAGGAK